MKGNDSVIYSLRRDRKDWIQLKENGDLRICVDDVDGIIDKRNVDLFIKRIQQICDDFKSSKNNDKKEIK